MSKSFSLNEAQTLIPVLQALLERARESALRANRHEGKMQALGQRILLSGGLHVDVPAAARTRAERDKAIAETRATISEIEAIGVHLRDLEVGVLELPSQLEGRPILLCWTLGEPEITGWREIDDAPEVRHPFDARFGRDRDRLQ